MLFAAANAGAGQRRKQPRKVAPPVPARKIVKAAAPAASVELEPVASDPDVENADIAITARVRARSLKFDVVPNPRVEFPGNPARDTVWDAQRENLPTPVQPGVTYRNIGIRLKITSVFRDIDRIVAEALGEVPVTDDKAITSATNNSPGPARTEPATSKPALSKLPVQGRRP